MPPSNPASTHALSRHPIHYPSVDTSTHEHLHTSIHACMHHLSPVIHLSFIHPCFCPSIHPFVIPVGHDPPSQPPTAPLGARCHNAAKVNVPWGQGTEGHLLPLPPPSPVEGTCGVGPGAVRKRRLMSGFVPTPGPHQLCLTPCPLPKPPSNPWRQEWGRQDLNEEASVPT